MHSESQWRHRAYRKGLRLVKYKETSPAYRKYGPYALVDQRTNSVVAAHLDAEAVERELFAGVIDVSRASNDPRVSPHS